MHLYNTQRLVVTVKKEVGNGYQGFGVQHKNLLVTIDLPRCLVLVTK